MWGTDAFPTAHPLPLLLPGPIAPSGLTTATPVPTARAKAIRARSFRSMALLVVGKETLNPRVGMRQEGADKDCTGEWNDRNVP